MRGPGAEIRWRALAHLDQAAFDPGRWTSFAELEWTSLAELAWIWLAELAAGSDAPDAGTVLRASSSPSPAACLLRTDTCLLSTISWPLTPDSCPLDSRCPKTTA